MKVFLVVMAVWDMAYRGLQVTPFLVQEMPNLATCEAVRGAIAEMSYKGEAGGYQRSKCVVVP